MLLIFVVKLGVFWRHNTVALTVGPFPHFLLALKSRPEVPNERKKAQCAILITEERQHSLSSQIPACKKVRRIFVVMTLCCDLAKKGPLPKAGEAGGVKTKARM